jgi:hypothetical protein
MKLGEYEMSKWKLAIDHFLTYLPQQVSDWIVVFQGSYHAKIVNHLRSSLAISHFLNLEADDDETIRKIEESNRENIKTGVLQFMMASTSLYDTAQYLKTGLRGFDFWPLNRGKLCLDVSDMNFCDLFWDSPHEIRNSCWYLRERISECSTLSYFNKIGEDELLTINCQGRSWVVYSGFEFDKYADYVLPTGEISCLPESVDGNITIEGWIVGTIPFGLKYGKIKSGELELRFQKRKVIGISGNNTKLCTDIELMLNRIPGLQVVTEVGIGQSKAVARAAAKQRPGYRWHEPHYGMHLGLGAELSDLQDINLRTTAHHLDIVLSSGHLSSTGGGDLLSW